MELGLKELYTPGVLSDSSGDDLPQGAIVDIVAVHGLAEDSGEAWTHRESGTVWLTDLLPQNIPNARVLTFDYDARPASFVGSDFLERIQSHATTLVANLVGDRELKDVSDRPIIFICHGLGGLIVKSALIHSASRTSRLTAHINAVYLSTFAILFFGTPHIAIDVGKWLHNIPTSTGGGCKDALGSVTRHPLEVITNGFVPLAKKFHIYNFWEGLETNLISGPEFMVEPKSAAPAIYEAERCGIPDSNHADMARFHKSQPAYQPVMAALMKYCHSAPAIVSYRWEDAKIQFKRMRASEASELTGFVIDIPDKRPLHMGSSIEIKISQSQNEHFYPPRAVSVDFLGQAEAIKQLEAAFNPQSWSPITGQKRFVLYGVGGSGKTEMACKFAQNNKDRYWAIFTIRATSAATIRESFSMIARKGGLESTEESGKHFLSQARKPWLLIIDNADRRELIFERLIPPGENGHILVTTQNPSLRRQGNVGSIEFTALGERDALRLLLHVSGIHRPWDSFTEKTGHEINKVLGYLALAIIQAGAAIYRKNCTLEEYPHKYSRFLESCREEKGLSSAQEKTPDVYSTFEFSFANLVSVNTIPSQDAVEILNIVSFYYFEDIRVDIFTKALKFWQKQHHQCPHRSLFQRFLDRVKSFFKSPPLLPRFLKKTMVEDDLCIRDALTELNGFSLIKYSHDAQTFSLHPLVHSWARSRIPHEEKSLWSVIAFNTLMSAVSIPSEEQEQPDLSFQRSLAPHLNECLEACPPSLKEFRILEFGMLRCLTIWAQPAFADRVQEMIQAAVKCGIVFAATGDFPRSASFLVLAKDPLIKLLGLADAKTTFLMLRLSDMYWGLGQLDKAIELQQQVITSRKKVIGSEHRKTLQAMDLLGHSFWLNGQYVQALELQESTAKKMQEQLGKDDNDTLDALDHLAVTLGAWHQYELSREIHQRVLATRLQTLEPDDLKVLETKKNLAMALLDLGDLERAKSLIEEVHEGRKQQIGIEHPFTLWARLYLAKILIEEGQLKRSEEILVDGIAAARRSLGDNHLGVLVGRGELALAYARQGRLKEAVELTVPTVATIKKYRGPHHPDYSHGMRKLGQLWEKCQEWKKALDAYSIALQATEKRLTARHPLYKIISDHITTLNQGPLASEIGLGPRIRSINT